MNDVLIPSARTVAENRKISKGVSNRNLLDNPWFTVNQRGQNNYTLSSPSGGSSIYTIDRWKILANTGETDLYVESNGIRIACTFTGGAEFIQPMGEVAEGTYTLSVKKADDTIVSETFEWDGEAASKALQVTNTLRAFLYDMGVYHALYFNFDASDTVTIKAVKLELGSVSTLANDIAPDYSEELLKCQRYFYKCDSLSNSFMSLSITHIIYGTILFPVRMRTNPAVVITSMRNHDSGATVSLTSFKTNSTAGGISSFYQIVPNILANHAYGVSIEATADL